MRVAFVLPCVSLAPVGGFKVVFEFANLLVERGHRVEVLMPIAWDEPASPLARLRRRRWARLLSRRPADVAPWTRIDPRVGVRVFSRPGRIELPPADAVVATAWETAELVAAATPPGRGFYLVQGYETWAGDPERVHATWRLPLRKLVVSRWLREIAAELGEAERTEYVPIGLDLERWGVDRPVDGRPPRVGVTFSPYKDPEDSIAALVASRAALPALEAAAFGTAPRPQQLPPWVEYVQRPDPARLRALYNSCSLFLQASKNEGWGLPAAEAMACGCALVTYDSGGSREYAEDGVTARVVAEHSPAALAAAILELADDRQLRLELSRRGGERVGTFTWDRAVAALEAALGAAEAAAR